MIEKFWYPLSHVYKVVLDRSYYARRGEIMNWLDHQLGPGMVYHLGIGANTQDCKWSLHMPFGYTTIRFADQEDMAQFLLAWN